MIIDDGWAQLRFSGVLAVIVGPVLAIFFSHIFGAALGKRVALGRQLTRHERRPGVADESRFLLIVPPVGILVVLSIVGVPTSPPAK